VGGNLGGQGENKRRKEKTEGSEEGRFGRGGMDTHGESCQGSKAVFCVYTKLTRSQGEGGRVAQDRRGQENTKRNAVLDEVHTGKETTRVAVG